MRRIKHFIERQHGLSTMTRRGLPVVSAVLLVAGAVSGAASAAPLPEAGEPAAHRAPDEPAMEPADLTDERPVTGDESPKAEPIDVVVTPKRKGEEPFFADRAVSVVRAKQLGEMQPRTTPEALWDTPGVFVQQTNHGAGAPIVRGLIGPQVLLLVDGVRLNNSVYRTGPLQYLALVDPMSVGRIEVLRGPGSVLYGSDAMGGVIQVFPHEPRDSRQLRQPEVHGTSLFRYGSASRAPAAHGRLELGMQGFGVLAGGSLQAVGDLRGGGDVGVQPHSGYQDFSALGAASYRFDEGPLAGASTKAGYLGSRLARAGRTDRLYDRGSLQIYDNEIHLLYDRLHFEVEPLATSIDLTPSYQYFFERQDTVSLAGDLRSRLDTLRDEVQVDTFGMDAGLETRLVDDRLALRYGGLFYRDWVDAQRVERSPGDAWQRRVDQRYPSGSTYDHFGGFVMVDAAPMATSDHRVGVRAGYRLHGMAGSAPATPGLAAVDYAHVGHVVMAAAQYVYAEQATVAVSFEQGFRAPNLQEAVMLGDAGQYFHVPSDDLAPERSDTVELLGRAKLWRLQWFWAGYVSMLQELLKREPTTYRGQAEVDGKEVVHHVNAESGTLLGMEAGLGIDLGRGLSLHGHLAYAWGEEHLPDGSSQPLSRVPPPFGLTSVRYDARLAPQWRGFVETYVRWALDQDRLSPRDQSDVRIPDGGTPGWWTWNIRTGVAGRGHHRLVLSVENLLDQEYKYHGSGLFAAGTNAAVSYEASF